MDKKVCSMETAIGKHQAQTDQELNWENQMQTELLMKLNTNSMIIINKKVDHHLAEDKDDLI